MFGSSTQQLFPENPMIFTEKSSVTFLSDIPPKLSWVFALLVTCNLCDSKLNLNPRLLGQIPIQAKFGDLILLAGSSNTAKLNIRPGMYDRIRIELMDQDYTPLQNNDLDFSIVLLIETTFPSK
jgi:hypothetical protein